MPCDGFGSIFWLIKNDAELSESEQLARLSSLLQTYPDVMHEKDLTNRTPLHYAAQASSPSFCKLLIESDTDLKSVKMKDNDGCLPFLYACGNNNLETVKYLFHLWPACINIPDNISRYPIHYAAANYWTDDNIELCQFLLKLDRGAVPKPDNEGRLPLHLACDSYNLEAAKIVYNAYPEGMNTPDENSQYPIHHLLKESKEQDVTDLFQFLLQHDQGAVAKSDNEGRLPLHLACFNNQLEAAKLLYDAYPEGMNTPDENLQYPLHHLLEESKGQDVTELFQFLLQHDQGAVTKPDFAGRLPLHLACYCHQEEAAKLLYDKYPQNINFPDNYLQYPIHHLLCNESNGEDVTELCKFLLQHDQGAVATPDDEGRLPLHLACDHLDDLEVIKLVYNAYPDGIHIEENSRGRTPLEISSWEAEAFLQNQLGCIREARDVRRPDNNGQLPLHWAIQNVIVSEGTIKLMIAENPDSALQADHQGLLPIHLACQAGNLEAIKYLVEKHHDDSFQVSDGRGEFPIHHACRHGRCEVVAYILQQTAIGVKEPNADGKLPIWSLLLDAPCDRDSLEYVGAVDLLLRACPVELVGRVL